LWLGLCFTKSNAYAPRPAHPTIFAIGHKRASPNVSTSSVNDVACSQTISRQSFCVGNRNAGNLILDNAILSKIRRHNKRNAICNVILGVQLTAKRSRLDGTSALIAEFADRTSLPIVIHVELPKPIIATCQDA
jgi:hypothetical protein